MKSFVKFASFILLLTALLVPVSKIVFSSENKSVKIIFVTPPQGEATDDLIQTAKVTIKSVQDYYATKLEGKTFTTDDNIQIIANYQPIIKKDITVSTWSGPQKSTIYELNPAILDSLNDLNNSRYLVFVLNEQCPAFVKTSDRASRFTTHISLCEDALLDLRGNGLKKTSYLKFIARQLGSAFDLQTIAANSTQIVLCEEYLMCSRTNPFYNLSDLRLRDSDVEALKKSVFINQTMQLPLLPPKYDISITSIEPVQLEVGQKLVIQGAGFKNLENIWVSEQEFQGDSSDTVKPPPGSQGYNSFFATDFLRQSRDQQDDNRLELTLLAGAVRPRSYKSIKLTLLGREPDGLKRLLTARSDQQITLVGSKIFTVPLTLDFNTVCGPENKKADAWVILTKSMERNEDYISQERSVTHKIEDDDKSGTIKYDATPNATYYLRSYLIDGTGSSDIFLVKVPDSPDPVNEDYTFHFSYCPGQSPSPSPSYSPSPSPEPTVSESPVPEPSVKLYKKVGSVTVTIKDTQFLFQNPEDLSKLNEGFGFRLPVDDPAEKETLQANIEIYYSGAAIPSVFTKTINYRPILLCDGNKMDRTSLQSQIRDKGYGGDLKDLAQMLEFLKNDSICTSPTPSHTATATPTPPQPKITPPAFPSQTVTTCNGRTMLLKDLDGELKRVGIYADFNASALLEAFRQANIQDPRCTNPSLSSQTVVTCNGRSMKLEDLDRELKNVRVYVNFDASSLLEAFRQANIQDPRCGNPNSAQSVNVCSFTLPVEGKDGLRDQLEKAKYDGPWDIDSMRAAYERAACP